MLGAGQGCWGSQGCEGMGAGGVGSGVRSLTSD